MVKNRFLAKLNQGIITGDGAMGTLLQKHSGIRFSAPEELILKEPGVVLKVHQEYVKAGAELIETNTLGATRIKLQTVGLDNDVKEINIQAASLARQAAGENIVAGSVGPTGRLMKPYGDLSFEEAVHVYQEQISLLVEGGVDVVCIETMNDLREVKAAVIAAREVRIPIIAQVTYNENGYTLTGNTPEVVAIVLDSLNVDVIGVNCVAGMEDAIPLLKRMNQVTERPLSVFPNAGIPFCTQGQTCFPGKPEEFITGIKDLIPLNVRLIGGCCGTTPEFIPGIKDEIELYQVDPLSDDTRSNDILYLSSSKDFLEINQRKPVRIIGEKLNPTGRNDLKDALRNNKWSYLRKIAREQVKAGAELLDVNIGIAGIDKEKVMARLVQELQLEVNVPLVLDSDDPEILETGLREYAGKALINSVNGDKKSIDKILPLVARYGAAVIGLTLDEKGIPATVEGRVEIAERIIKAAAKYGIKQENIVIDTLVLTAGAKQKEVMIAIKALERVKEKFGVKTVLGVSNVSHGLPARNLINETYLAMALGAGLDLPITNPFNERIHQIIAAANLLTARDRDGQEFLEKYKDVSFNKGYGNFSFRVDVECGGEGIKDIINAVIDGDRDNILYLTEKALKEVEASKIIQEALIPGINRVGELYDQGSYFLPQLIKGAETVQVAFDHLKGVLSADQAIKAKATILLATVAGDVHDIGKNIVKIIFANHGFEVIDLGTNIQADMIVEKALEYQVDFVGLSSLMTTTLPEMGKVIQLLKERDYPGQVIIGGAVTTEEFAQEIGAEFQAIDALDGVRKIELYLQGKVK